MVKNTQSGSFLAKHFPTLFKHFSENASQEDFNKAEQEAAIVFQQRQTENSATEVPKAEATAVVTGLAALFPNSHKTVSEKFSAEELKAFAAETQEIQNRLTAQTTGNQAVAADLTKAQADLTKAQTELTATNAKLTELTPKAAAWDAHKAALNGATVTDDTTNTKGGKTKADNQLSAKDQSHLDRMAELKAKYPSLMADIDVPALEE